MYTKIRISTASHMKSYQVAYRKHHFTTSGGTVTQVNKRTHLFPKLQGNVLNIQYVLNKAKLTTPQKPRPSFVASVDDRRVQS